MELTKEQIEKIKYIIDNQIYCLQNLLVNKLLDNDFFSYDDIKNLEENDEICQWFLIDDHLGDRMEEKGAVILRNDYGCWYGRLGCGYSLEKEAIFREITSD